MACHNLISAEVVTADGRILPCSAVQNADLFWGLRGAGANFGVATEFEYRLHPVSKVLGGPILFPLRADVLRFFDEFLQAAPEELTTLGVILTGPGGNSAF